MKKGFTLIELLVVVLIIGILAAIALPKYQMAVEKSRLSSVMAAVRSFKDQAEVYYLSNGSYPADNAAVLDGFDIPEGCAFQQGSSDWGAVVCANSVIDLGVGTGSASQAVLGVARNSKKNNILAYVMFLDHSNFAPGQTECWAATGNEMANQICKSLQGTANRTFSFSWFEGGQTTAYRLK